MNALFVILHCDLRRNDCLLHCGYFAGHLLTFNNL